MQIKKTPPTILIEMMNSRFLLFTAPMKYLNLLAKQERAMQYSLNKHLLTNIRLLCRIVNGKLSARGDFHGLMY